MQPGSQVNNVLRISPCAVYAKKCYAKMSRNYFLSYEVLKTSHSQDLELHTRVGIKSRQSVHSPLPTVAISRISTLQYGYFDVGTLL